MYIFVSLVTVLDHTVLQLTKTYKSDHINNLDNNSPAYQVYALPKIDKSGNNNIISISIR